MATYPLVPCEFPLPPSAFRVNVSLPGFEGTAGEFCARYIRLCQRAGNWVKVSLDEFRHQLEAERPYLAPADLNAMWEQLRGGFGYLQANGYFSFERQGDDEVAVPEVGFFGAIAPLAIRQRSA